jgi:hypothetical protein
MAMILPMAGVDQAEKRGRKLFSSHRGIRAVMVVTKIVCVPFFRQRSGVGADENSLRPLFS